MIENAEQFLSGLDKSVDRFHNRFKTMLRSTMHATMVRLLRRTPVNTGRAVMNYVASAGTPASGPVKSGFKTVEPTNDLRLGAEQLRPAAEAVAMATLQGINYDKPFQAFYISNRAPNIAGLEAGELPHAPYTPRSPQGMFRVTLQEIAQLLESGRL